MTVVVYVELCEGAFLATDVQRFKFKFNSTIQVQVQLNDTKVKNSFILDNIPRLM